MSEKTFEFTRTFKQPSQKVWGFLTESEKLSRWFLPNDFSLVEKEEFRLWTTPTPAWDGVLLGKVNDYVENKSLSYELTTSQSSDTSQVEWTIDEGQGCSHLNLSHEGSEILIDTIYKAINGTQVSGHINREQMQPVPPVQSDIHIKQNDQKPFLESLRNQLLQDPENIEFAVSQTVAKYPSYLDQIVCLAVDAFPEKAMNILEAAKSVTGGNFQRLLGLTLFLLLFKDAISDAQAANAEEKAKEAASEHEHTEDEELLLLEEEDPELASMLQEFKGQMANGNIRAAFGIAVAMIIFVTADPAMAAAATNEFAEVIDAALTVDGEEELILNDTDVPNAQEILGYLPELVNTNGQIGFNANINLVGPVSSGIQVSKLQRNVETKLSRKSDDHPAQERGNEISSMDQQEYYAEQELILDEAILEFGDELVLGPVEGELYVEDDDIPTYEINWVDALMMEWSLQEGLIEENEVIEEDEVISEEEIIFIDDPEAEYIETDQEHDDEYPPDTYEQVIEEITSFIEYVEERLGEEVYAMVMTENGPELFFSKEDFDYFTAEFLDEAGDIFIVDSQEFYEDVSLSNFDEIESYTTTEYVETIDTGNSYL